MPTPLQFSKSFKPDNIRTDSAAVEYNGWKFPPCIRATASIDPMYDDSGRMLKYQRFKIKVAFYLFHGLNLGTGTAASPSPSSALYGTYTRSSHLPSGVNDSTKTTDAEMDYVRKRLQEPGQPFYFSAQGIGTFLVNVPQSATVNLSATPSYLTYDVDNGPKPNVITWRPLTNKCCLVEWEVACCLSACYGDTDADENTIAQFPYDVDFSINRKGLTTRRISGSIEFALTREPNGGDAHADGSRAFEFRDYRNQVNAVFPMIPRFFREQDYNLSSDRKTVTFTITDTEVDSDEPYGEGCVHEDISLSANNTHRKVFSIFDVTLSGTIELAAGYPKSYAFAEITRLFNKFYTVNSVLGQRVKLKGAAAVERLESGSSSPTVPESGLDATSPSRAIIEHVSFTDNIFGRSISFSIKWTLFSTLATLFQATGLFTPVTPSGAPAQNAWNRWKQSLGVFLDNGGYHNLGFNQDDDVIVSLCQSPFIGAPSDPETPIETNDLDEAEDPAYEQDEKDADAWLSYHSCFDIIVDNHTISHSPLGNYDSPQEISTSPDVAAALTEYTAPGIPEELDDTQDAIHHTRRHPTYLLRFSGSAIRLNYPVPVPHVEKAYGQPLRRVGVSQIKPRFLGMGTDPVTGKSYKIFGLMWSIDYALPAPPLNSTIKTDAFKEIYN